MKAYCLIRHQPVYRREAFVKGLAAAGLNVSNALPQRPGPDDVLVIWNRYGENHDLAIRFERGGGRVIVAENGYVGAKHLEHRAHDDEGRRMMALALHDHNGRGAWPYSDPAVSPDPSRWEELGIELKPWRTGGVKFLVAGQRGIGSPGRASPNGWHDQVAAQIRSQLKARAQVRTHPGDNQPEVPLEKDLEGAIAIVIWASGAGIKAMIEGYPVAYACPWWICAEAATRYQSPQDLVGILIAIAADRSLAGMDAARLRALQRMAWAQWTVDEIATGEPFRRLLELPYSRAAAS